MAFLSLQEEARIWQSLDDNLRAKIRTGELSFEEAAKFVVPIGDVELQNARAQYPTRPSLDQEEIPESTAGEEYGLGTMIDTSLGRLGAFVDTVGAGVDSSAIEQAENIQAAGETSLFDTIGRFRQQREAAERPRQEAPWYINPVNKVFVDLINSASDAITGTAEDVGQGIQTEIQRAIMSDETVQRYADESLISLSQNVEQLEDTRNYLNSLPANPYSSAFIKHFDEGDYIRAATSAPLAVVTTLGEQAPTLLAQMGITMGTYAVTRNRAATARAAALAGGVGGLSEYGSDYLSIVENMPPEDRRNLTKLRAALDQAKESAVARTVIESMLPGGLGALGRSTVGRVAGNLTGQMAGGALGEAEAAAVMGQERSAGELALEALADSAGVITEAYPSLRQAAKQDRIDLEAERYVEQERNLHFARELQALEQQNRANKNRQKFDAEVEADRLIEAMKFQSPTQMEMPFGSDMAGDALANDRVPTIVDMFSGESRAAPAVQAELDRRVGPDQMPEETDEAFEIRKRREFEARTEIEGRKQTAFEQQKVAEEQERTRTREQEASDAVTLKNQKQLLSTTDITREAKRLVEVEKEGLRRQRAGIVRDPKNMDALLKAYERKRLPELIDSVRKTRTQQVNEAARRDIDRENQKLQAERESPEGQARRAEEAQRAFLKQPGTPRKPTVTSRLAPVDLLPENQQDAGLRVRSTGTLIEGNEPIEGEMQEGEDLLNNIPGQRELVLPPGTGTSQLELDVTAEQTKKADASQKAAIEAEIPTVDKAIAQAQIKRANLTVKKYAKTEQEVLSKIVEEELQGAGNRSQAEVRERVATRMAEWRAANPRPEAAPAPAADLVEQAKTVQKRKESTKKAAETKATNKALAKALEQGATPEEAAEMVAQQRLSKLEEDALREELALGAKRSPDQEAEAPTTAPATAENPDVREAVDHYSQAPYNAISAVLNAIVDSKSATTEQKWLATRLSRLITNLGIRIIPDPQSPNTVGWGGAFVKAENAIWIRKATVENVLHEALHAVTTNLIEAADTLNNPKVKAATQRLNEILEAARKNFNDTKNGAFFSSRPALRAFLESKNGPLSSASEFLAYGLSNYQIAAWLQGVKSENQSWGKRLWDGFKSVFQILYTPRTPEQRSLLDELVENAENFMFMQELDTSLNARALREARRRTRKPARNDQTETPAFKSWFGDSKVVDDNGNPLRVYHGSRSSQGITSFKYGRAFFTSEPSVANTYSSTMETPRGATYPVYLSLQNPLIIEGRGRSWTQLDEPNIDPRGPNTTDGWVSWAEDKGYDGVIFRDIVDSGMGLSPPSDVYVALEPRQVKSAVGNVGEFSPMSEDLSAAMDVDLDEVDFTNPSTRSTFLGVGGMSLRPEWTNKNTLGGAIVDAFSSGAGGLKVSTEIFDRAQSDTAALIFRAEKLYRIIDSSLEARAPQTREGIEKYRQTFIDDITAFENEESRLTKAKLAKEIRTKYGQAGRAYFTMRRTIDSLSRDILQQRLDDPRPFTNAEAKIYRSIRDNIGKYYTRVYAANTKGLGQKRNKELRKAYNAVVKGSTEQQYLEGYQTVKAAAMFIRDNVLAIPDREELEGMPLIRLQKLASAWGIMPLSGADLDNPLVGESLRESLVDGLMKFADKSQQAKDSKALELVLEALDRSDSTIMNYYRGAKQDRTIVTEREGVPVEIRKLLGEFEDVPLRAMITIARQAEFRARNKAFNELLATEQGKRIMTQEEFTESGLDPAEWPVLKDVAYGALQGMRVRKDLAARLEDSAEVARTFEQTWAMAESRPLEIIKKAAGEAITGWARFASAVKAVQLVWNVGNAAFNFLGGPLIMMANGNLSPKQATRALGIAWDLINSARASTPPTKDMEKVVRAGITDSAFMGEIRAVELEQLRQLTLEGFASEAGRKAGKVRQAVRGSKRMWREAYAMADVTWKIANFLAEEQKLTDFYKAEGITKSSEQIEREAAWRTNLSNFSYKRVPNILKVVEKGGLTYVMPYIYETIRSNVGSIFVGKHDLQMAAAATTPEGRRIMAGSGTKRIIGSLMALGVAQQIAVAAIRTVSEAMGETDEEQEQWVEDMKAMLPEFKRWSDYVYMGRNEDGKPVLFELSRLDPFGPVTEFYRMAVQGATPEEMLDGLGNMWINNPYGSSILTAFFGTPGTSTRMERIQPGFTGGLTNTITAALDFVPFVDITEADAGARRLIKAVDAVFPSMPLNIFDPNNKNAEGDVVGWMMTNLMGVKVHNVDPAKATQYVGMEFKAGQTGVRDAFYNYLKTSEGLSQNELLSRYTALQEQEQENYEKVEKQYSALLELGYTDAQALSMLKTAGLSQNDLALIYSGGYRPQYSGIVNFQNLEQSLMNTVKIPGNEAKGRQYLENIITLAQLVESGQIPARSN